jgi:hypothetical protein
VIIYRARNRAGVSYRRWQLFRRDFPAEARAVVWIVACLATAAVVLLVAG